MSARDPLGAGAYPVAGEAREAAAAVRGWATAAWLLSVEVRAYLEDLDGGAEQPDLQRAVAVRLLETLAEADAHLAGARPPAPAHALAAALEHGLGSLGRVRGDELAALLELDVPLEAGAPAGAAGVRSLAERLVEEFPGDLPDPLEPAGQSQMLRALRNWSKLADAAGIDASFLEPFLRSA